MEIFFFNILYNLILRYVMLYFRKVNEKEERENVIWRVRDIIKKKKMKKEKEKQ